MYDRVRVLRRVGVIQQDHIERIGSHDGLCCSAGLGHMSRLEQAPGGGQLDAAIAPQVIVLGHAQLLAEAHQHAFKRFQRIGTGKRQAERCRAYRRTAAGVDQADVRKFGQVVVFRHLAAETDHIIARHAGSGALVDEQAFRGVRIGVDVGVFFLHEEALQVGIDPDHHGFNDVRVADLGAGTGIALNA